MTLDDYWSASKRKGLGGAARDLDLASFSSGTSACRRYKGRAAAVFPKHLSLDGCQFSFDFDK